MKELIKSLLVLALIILAAIIALGQNEVIIKLDMRVQKVYFDPSQNWVATLPVIYGIKGDSICFSIGGGEGEGEGILCFSGCKDYPESPVTGLVIVTRLCQGGKYSIRTVSNRTNFTIFINNHTGGDTWLNYVISPRKIQD